MSARKYKEKGDNDIYSMVISLRLDISFLNDNLSKACLKCLHRSYCYHLFRLYNNFYPTWLPTRSTAVATQFPCVTAALFHVFLKSIKVRQNENILDKVQNFPTW